MEVTAEVEMSDSFAQCISSSEESGISDGVGPYRAQWGDGVRSHLQTFEVKAAENVDLCPAGEKGYRHMMRLPTQDTSLTCQGIGPEANR